MAAQQLTTFTETPEGLLIELSKDPDHQEDIQEIKEKFEKGEYSYSTTWWELNEVNFCNGYHEVPDKYKGLTDAPMISDAFFHEEMSEEYACNAKVWAFLDYMVRNEIQELFDKGFVLFNKIENTLQ
jgi:hypothetical protein